MISFLEGVLQTVNDQVAIINVGGVGYRVYINTDTRSKLPAVGCLCQFSIYTHVREDALNLYGFLEQNHLQFFELLLSVSGVGPKLAMTICGSAPISVLQQAIVANDPSVLKKVPGVGKRTSERLVVDLREKVAALGVKAGSTHPATSDAAAVIEALQTMGYNDVVARGALEHASGNTVEQKLTSALQYLGKQS